jgi:signal peptidase I
LDPTPVASSEPRDHSVFFREVTLRVGQGTAIALEHLDPEEVLAEPVVHLAGSLGGRLPEGLAVRLRQTLRGRRTFDVPLEAPARGRFNGRLQLRNGLNEFCLQVVRPDGEILQERVFGISYKSSFREWNETIFIAFVLALIIRSLVVQAFWIPTGSMEPTLYGEKHDPQTKELTRSGDRILVNRFAYVADLSLDGRIPFAPRIWLAMPRRGDIIVFKFPDPDPNAPPRDFIKRVIGLPGDEVRIIDGTVFINGTPLKEPYIAEPPWQDYSTTVPSDSLFVMGDNRNNSADSRFWGPMPLANLKGQAVLIYSPLKRIRPIRSYPHPVLARAPSSSGS